MSWQIRNSAATITYNNENKREPDKLFDFIRNVLVGMIDRLRDRFANRRERRRIVQHCV